MKTPLNHHTHFLVQNPPEKPLLVYDGDCGFCRQWIQRWRFLTGDRVAYEPYQKASVDFPEIPRERFKKSVQLIEPDGTVTQGAEAVFGSLSVLPALFWLLWVYRFIPGFAFVSETLYTFVADHRQFFSSVSACGTATADTPSTYFISRWIFLKILGLSYLAAFGSLWPQVQGLIGSGGILPVGTFLSEVKAELGGAAFRMVPTLCWLNDSDGFLRFLCGAGVVLSLLLVFDVLPILCLPLLWFLYLSLVSVGQDFLSFQWDNLLLEAGFLSVFLVPFKARVGRAEGPPISKPVIFLFRWLLFRLLFSSGVVKLLSGDPSWRNLTALRYHYETQPLPTTLAWYFHQLPDWFQTMSCLYMFVVELILPFLIFGPRRWRPWVFGFFVSLQGLIALTGNYCFFNLLTVGLCFLVLEDEAFPLGWKNLRAETGKKRGKAWPSWATLPLLALALYLSLFQMVFSLGARFQLPELLALPFQWTEPFRTVNSYGLFAVMTETRQEIQVEGSRDGTHWLPYEFKWKPGNLSRAPSFVAPIQPRLDWQMWFAALGNYRNNPWFVHFLLQVLKGSPEVLGLLKINPFPGNPPLYVRAELERYRFTDFKEKSQTGQWWQKEPLGLYIPAFSLEGFQKH